MEKSRDFIVTIRYSLRKDCPDSTRKEEERWWRLHSKAGVTVRSVKVEALNGE